MTNQKISTSILNSILETLKKIQSLSHEQQKQILGYSVDHTYQIEAIEELIRRKVKEQIRVGKKTSRYHRRHPYYQPEIARKIRTELEAQT